MAASSPSKPPWIVRSRLRLAGAAVFLLMIRSLADTGLSQSWMLAALWWLTFVTLCLMVFLGTLIDYRLKSWRWMAVQRICPWCNYRLGKIPTNKCPECGRDIGSASPHRHP